MPLVLVAVMSILVGAAVYLGTVRSAERRASTGFGHDEVPETVPTFELPEPAPAPGYAYLQVSTQGPSLRDRLVGFFGVLVLIAVSAAVLAFALYEVGHLINATIETFLEK